MKNLERDRRRKKGAIGSQDGGFRTFERRTGHADGRSATCILVGGADVTVYSVCSLIAFNFVLPIFRACRRSSSIAVGQSSLRCPCPRVLL